MLNVYLRTPQTDAGAWLNFPASYQTVQHLFSVLGDLLDEEKVGQEMRRSDMGTYTEAGYIFPNSMPHQEWYDGIHLPDIPDMPKGVISVLLSSLDKPDEVGVWLELPATEQEMQSVLKQLGEHSFDNCLIAGSISTAFPYPLAGDEDVEKLNTLAQKIQAFPDQRTLAKFKAALELEIRNEIDFALDVAENLDCYDFDPRCTPLRHMRNIFSEKPESIQTIRLLPCSILWDMVSGRCSKPDMSRPHTV